MISTSLMSGILYRLYRGVISGIRWFVCFPAAFGALLLLLTLFKDWSFLTGVDSWLHEGYVITPDDLQTLAALGDLLFSLATISMFLGVAGFCYGVLCTRKLTEHSTTEAR